MKQQSSTGFKGLFARLTIAGLIALPLSPAAAEEATEAKPDVPGIGLVYDLSNSMWAPISQKSKIIHAQTGIISGLEGLNGKINFGLTSFGHKEKTGCDNVETILPMQPLDLTQTKAALKPLRPRGNAPTAKALLNAAGLAANRAAPYTIILVSDGPTNCPADPCKTAQDLQKSFPALTIDVIALGNTEKTVNDLRCLVAPSKGTITKALNSTDIAALIKGSVKRAIERTSTRLISKTPPEAGEKAEQDGWAGATEIIVTPREKEVTGALEEDARPKDKFSQQNDKLKKTHGGLALIAHLADKGAPIKSGIVWRIYNEKPAKGSQKHNLISAHKSAQPVMSLPKGTYLINAAYGRAFLTRKVVIDAGVNNTEHFILNAGGLKIASVLANGNPVADNTVYYDIFADERDQFGKRLKVIGKVRPGLVVRLNAGIYHVVSTYGDANAKSRADVSVEAGKLTEATIDHKAAKVTFKLVYQKGGEALADTKWSLLSTTGKLIKKSAGALPTHYLAAGDYKILAIRGEKKYSQDFTIEPGDQKQIEVIIQ